MCPYLLFDDNGSGICSIRGLTLSPAKVSGFCESSVYVECDTYSHSVDEYGYDGDSDEEEFNW